MVKQTKREFRKPYENFIEKIYTQSKGLLIKISAGCVLLHTDTSFSHATVGFIKGFVFTYPFSFCYGYL